MVGSAETLPSVCRCLVSGVASLGSSRHRKCRDCAAAAGKEGDAIRLLAFTGLRFGELAGPRVRRVNPLRRRITVAESVTEVDGQLVWSMPKDHHTRCVPIPRSLADALGRARVEQGA